MNIAERDIIVVGAGNAATCAALSARENCASVLMLEIAPEEAACGNSAFTGGAFRVVYHGFDDLAQLIPDCLPTAAGPRVKPGRGHRGASAQHYRNCSVIVATMVGVERWKNGCG